MDTGFGGLARRAGVRRARGLRGRAPGRGCSLVAALLAFLAAPVPGGARAADTQAAAGAPFRRGVAVHDLLNWGNLRADDRQRYTDAPFTGPNHQTSEGALRNAARAGFDFVRLTVDPGPFLQLAGAPRAALDQDVLDDVARLRRLGFGVLVDIHPVEQVPRYGRAMVQPGAQPGIDAYRGLVARMARLLGGLHSRSVALELMNEPDGYDPASEARWQRELEGLHAAARAEAPDLLLVLSGAEGSDARALPHLDVRPFAGSNVMYTFHYYEPHVFTHQGVHQEGGGDDVLHELTGLPYPSTFPFDPLRLAQANVDADPAVDAAHRPRLIGEVRAAAAAYAAGGYDRARVRRDFDRVSAWAAAQGVPADRILLGEFGVARQTADHVGADPLSAEAWLRDVRQEAEAHGFAWSYWSLADEASMQLVVADRAATLDPGVLAALGLRAPEDARR